MTADPFEGILDETRSTPLGARTALLSDAKRGWVPIRKTFVQHANTAATRPSVLGALVSGRLELALDALLILHALMPVLPGSPLPLSTWADLLATKGVPNTAVTSRVLRNLQKRGLLTYATVGKYAEVIPKMEDGSGHDWVKAGSVAEHGPGYFTIPYDYWTTDLVNRLGLPGKAMLLVSLAETSKKPSFPMAVERAQEWYGFSERTAERGFSQLSAENLLQVHIQKVNDNRVPGGVRRIYHRALRAPYSMQHRATLQQTAQAAAQAQAATP